MGTWGTGPFDNDDAADMVAVLCRPITVVNKRKSDASASYRYNEARAAAKIMMVSHGTDILGGPSLIPALQALARIRGDQGWLAGWRQPRKIAKAVEADMLAILDTMGCCRSCKKDKDIRREAALIVEQAQFLPIPKSTFGSRQKHHRRTKRAAKRTTKRR